ncbi:MAG: asparagine synthase (glutamine-hydrolyzing) [Pelagibacteraceae bacterium]
MCGIGGVINLSKDTSKLELRSISTIRKMIAARGPDHDGNWLSKDKDLVLTIQRLATQDGRPLANQPCFSSDKKIIAIMNGEIYNQKNLRTYLKLKGYKFKSLNDTEVVANAYHHWGKRFLNKIEGQFSIVVYNIENKVGIIARDEHGICPLYYLKNKKKVIFSSTPESIFNQLKKKILINKKALSDYVISGCMTEGNTLFEDIKYLEPGSFFEFKTSKNIVKKEFANKTSFLKEKKKIKNKKKKYYINQIFKVLKENVKNAISGDKKVGVFLSSGLDSVFILALYRCLCPNLKIQTFTAAFEDIKDNTLVGELKNVKKICKYFNVENKVVRIKSRDLIKSLGTFSQPSSGILEFTNKALAEAARKNKIEVILSGEGSDEMFFGYDHNLSVISFFKKNFNFLQKKFRFRNKRINRLISRKKIKIEDLFLFGGANIDLDFNRKKIFNKKLLEEKSIKKTITQTINKYKLKNPKDVDKIIVMLDYEIKVPELFLRRADYPAMNAGVEMRFPFLNKNIKDLLYLTPLNFKIDKSLVQKMLLRQAASKIVPKNLFFEKLPFGVPGVLNKYFSNSKTNFDRPAFKSIFNKNLSYIKKLLFYGSHTKLNFFKDNFLRELINKQKSYKDCYFDNTLWKLVSFAAWYEKKYKKFN